MNGPSTARRHLRVEGVVQGVGFRPFVERLARRHQLAGFVRNDASVVVIEVEGERTRIGRFVRELSEQAPPLARISAIVHREATPVGDHGFRIIASVAADAGSIVSITPDAALCEDCRRELLDPHDRRYRHPFITCTNCGPRFTIIEKVPYDRPNTTMRRFTMCAACSSEYDDIDDRRHHAQPIACNDCGPTLRYEAPDASRSGTDAVLAAVLADLDDGRIVAIKGVGGYHLAVDATDDHAVELLRTRKGRADKPFAVMVRDLAAASALARVDTSEAIVLESSAHPIVLLRARDDSPVSTGVAPGNPLIGIMLPYSPLHRLLFEPVPGRLDAPPATALVLTSGNRSGEPICADDADARRRLGPIADSFCLHDRPIHRPCDDSVVRVVDGHELPLRRSRGYAPLPLRLPLPVPATLAVGGELKNTVAVAAGEHAWMSQHLGDLETLATIDEFERTVDDLPRMVERPPGRVVADSHPGYHSSRWARRSAPERDLDLVSVQHHHAHLASLLGEHGVAPDRDVIGFVFDGTGFGPDGTSWGGEILVGGYGHVDRWGHLSPVLLPGGDSAATNPCRSALAWLRSAHVPWTADLAPVGACSTEELAVLDTQLDRSVHCVTSTSMGRLFDAVASLLDLRHRISYEAQAAIELEILAGGAGRAVPMAFGGAERRLDARPIIRSVVRAIAAGHDRAEIALGFHVALVAAMVRAAEALRSERGLEMVGLTGGVWQNECLVRLATQDLRNHGFETLTHRLVPPNDGGLALGQVLVAACAGGATDTTNARGDAACV